MTVLNCGPKIVDLDRLRAGDDTLVYVNLKADGVPWDITGYTVAAQVRKTPMDASSVMSPVVTVLDASLGKVTALFQGEAIRTLMAGANRWQGVWDLEVASGDVARTVCAGRVVCEMDVTRGVG